MAVTVDDLISHIQDGIDALAVQLSLTGVDAPKASEAVDLAAAIKELSDEMRQLYDLRERLALTTLP
jgi:hypothetical protein